MSLLTIAHFSPLPPQRSGIATYCAALLPHLSQHMQVEVYVDDPLTIDADLARRYRPHSIREFASTIERRYRYDMAVYHMGNQPDYHWQTYSACVSWPGIVVLHEIDLHALFWNWPASDRHVYIREMGYAYGIAGTGEARQQLAGGDTIAADTRPLFNRLADLSLGVIVHTPFARERVMTGAPRARVACIPEGIRVPAPAVPEHPPELFNRFPPDAIVLGSFGYIAPPKRIDRVLWAIAQLRQEFPHLHYVLVGETIAGYDLAPLIADLDLNDMVHAVGFVDDAQFQAYINAIDIGINLRSGPTGGEMSATLLQLLAAARPTIVSNVGGFATLPDECVIKIDQDQTELDRLVAALRSLIVNPAKCAVYGAAAQRYARSEFSLARVAQQYADFIHECQAAIVSRFARSMGA